MKETSLHTTLKDWYTQAGDRQEVNVEGFLIDVVSGGELIEIQTRNFAALKVKLAALLENHAVRLVHPIAAEKWIITLSEDAAHPIRRRKSPRRGRFEDIFYELVSIPQAVAHPNFRLELALIREEEVRRPDGRGSWRRRGVSIIDRRLVQIIERRTLNNPQDLLVFLPAGLPQPFTNAELARSLHIPPRLASKMSFCLRSLGLLQLTGKRGRSHLFDIPSAGQ